MGQIQKEKEKEVRKRVSSDRRKEWVGGKVPRGEGITESQGVVSYTERKRNRRLEKE